MSENRSDAQRSAFVVVSFLESGERAQKPISGAVIQSVPRNPFGRQGTAGLRLGRTPTSGVNVQAHPQVLKLADQGQGRIGTSAHESHFAPSASPRWTARPPVRIAAPSNPTAPRQVVTARVTRSLNLPRLAPRLSPPENALASMMESALLVCAPAVEALGM
jgi:hypothetical protein